MINISTVPTPHMSTGKPLCVGFKVVGELEEKDEHSIHG